MTLLDRHQRAIAAMTALQAGRGDLQESIGLQQFIEQKLQPELSRLARLGRAKEQLQRQSIESEVDAPSAKLREAVQALRTSFEKTSMRATLVDAQGWETVNPLLQAYCGNAEAQLQGAWSDYCAGLIPIETLEDLQADAVISLHRENRAMLQDYGRLCDQLGTLQATLPTSAKAIEQFNASARSAASLLQQLNRQPPAPSEIPPEAVVLFLQRVQAGPVGLDGVSPEVLEWLKEKGRLADYQIQVRVS